MQRTGAGRHWTSASHALQVRAHRAPVRAEHWTGASLPRSSAGHALDARNRALDTSSRALDQCRPSTGRFEASAGSVEAMQRTTRAKRWSASGGRRRLLPMTRPIIGYRSVAPGGESHRTDRNIQTTMIYPPVSPPRPARPLRADPLPTACSPTGTGSRLWRFVARFFRAHHHGKGSRRRIGRSSSNASPASILRVARSVVTPACASSGS